MQTLDDVKAFAFMSLSNTQAYGPKLRHAADAAGTAGTVMAGQSQHGVRCEQQHSSDECNSAEEASCSLNETNLGPHGPTSAAAAAAAFEQQQQLLGKDELIQGVHAYLYDGMDAFDEEHDSLAGLSIGSDDADLPDAGMIATDNPCSSVALPVVRQPQQQQQEGDLQHCQQHQSQHRIADCSCSSARNPPAFQQLSSMKQVQHAMASSHDVPDPLLQLLKKHQHQRQQQQPGALHNDAALLDLLPPLQQQQQQQRSPVGQAQVSVPAAAVQATQELLAGLSLHLQSQQAETRPCQHRQQQQQQRNQQQRQQQRQTTVGKSSGAGLGSEADDPLDTRNLLQQFCSEADGDPLLLPLTQQQQQPRNHEGASDMPPLLPSPHQHEKQQQHQEEEEEEVGGVRVSIATAAVQATQELLAGLSLHLQSQQAETRPCQHRQQWQQQHNQQQQTDTIQRSSSAARLAPEAAETLDVRELLQQFRSETDGDPLLLLLTEQQPRRRQHGVDEYGGDLLELLPCLQQQQQGAVLMPAPAAVVQGTPARLAGPLLYVQAHVESE